MEVTKVFVDSHQAPVGQIQWKTNLASMYERPGNVKGMRWASGTLISNDLFLTAGHAFDQGAGRYDIPKVNGTNDKIPPEEIAKSMHVNFIYQYDPDGNLQQEKNYGILDLLEYRNKTLDYAIVKLDGEPGKTFGYTPISSIDPSVGDMLCIIGHPEGFPKRLATGSVTAVHDDVITYNDLDTLFGDSGSGILSNSQGKIVVVHTTGGCDKKNIGYNSGIRLSVIRSVSPIISSIIK